MDKVAFNARLQQIPIKGHPNYRPFQCYGYPLDADVFIIGLNPANPNLPNWWGYWDADKGFNFDGFERQNVKFRRKKSVTRKRTELVIQGLGPRLKWVETNIYAIASIDMKALKAENRTNALSLLDTSSLDLLLQACRPRAIFVHGKDPCNHLGRIAGGINLRQINFMDSVELTLNGHTTRCYPLKNQLGRPGIKGVGDASMLTLGRKIRQELSV